MFHELHKLDTTLLIKFQKLPASVRPVMLAGTILGKPITLVGILVIFTSYMYLIKEFTLAKVGAGVAALLVVSAILKLLFQRSRPDVLLFVNYQQPSSYSFPSGHAYGSILVFGLIAYLAITRLKAPLNIIVPAILALFVVIIGISRIYLGAHYPTDIVAGWLLGVLVLTIVIKVSRI